MRLLRALARCNKICGRLIRFLSKTNSKRITKEKNSSALYEKANKKYIMSSVKPSGK